MVFIRFYSVRRGPRRTLRGSSTCPLAQLYPAFLLRPLGRGILLCLVAHNNIHKNGCPARLLPERVRRISYTTIATAFHCCLRLISRTGPVASQLLLNQATSPSPSDAASCLPKCICLAVSCILGFENSEDYSS